MTYYSTLKFWFQDRKNRYGETVLGVETPRDISGHISPSNFHGYSVYIDIDRGSEYIGEAKTMFGAKQVFAKWYEEKTSQSSQTKRRAAPIAALPGEIETQFYPTPENLAGKMLGKIRNPEFIETVLEPSAGKGDLIDCLGRYFARQYRRRSLDVEEKVDAIEIDENLRYLLKGKGYRVVADDFLSFETQKHYDLILMNPPFAAGDRHLMKALQMQKDLGGQIICLLNAETIRNPYTNLRKLLRIKLTEYDASIEFIKDAFKKAERRTDVEVAIVSVIIPRKERESNIYARLRKAQEKKYQTEYEVHDLVAGDWMEQMVRGYELEAELGVALIQEYNRISPYIRCSSKDGESMIRLSIGDRAQSLIGSEGINRFLRLCRHKYWEALLNREEVTSKMTSSMRSSYHSKIDSMSNYDFTVWNIRQVFFEITEQLQGGVKESILWLFNELSSEHSWYPECAQNRHYYNGWATNKAHKVGMKAILPINGFHSSYGWMSGKLDEYSVSRVISDLERSLNYLEKGEAEYKIDLYSRIKMACEHGDTKIEFTYFTAQFYKKGTCHIRFKPKAAPLIDRLNIFAAREKTWLPPSYGRKHYDDMDEEEKNVIDEFQGKEAYEKVVATPSEYILDTSSIKYLPGV